MLVQHQLQCHQTFSKRRFEEMARDQDDAAAASMEFDIEGVEVHWAGIGKLLMGLVSVWGGCELV